MKYLDLRCSCCGYIPDDDDIKKTEYKLKTCDCGRENVCDLCLGHLKGEKKLSCPVCSHIGTEIGSARKFYLSNEY